MKFSFKDFFAGKRYGYYVCLATALLCLITAIAYGVYGGSADGRAYFSGLVVVCLLVGVLSFLALSLFGCTRRYASAALAIFVFVAFLLFIRAVFYYFSVLFYSGVNAEAFASVNGGFAASFILFLLTLLTSSVALYLPQDKKTAQEIAAEKAQSEKAKPKKAVRTEKPFAVREKKSVSSVGKKRERGGYGMSQAEADTARALSDLFDGWEEK